MVGAVGWCVEPVCVGREVVGRPVVGIPVVGAWVKSTVGALVVGLSEPSVG